MRYLIKAPALIDTTIDLPASKSISNRVLIINALAGGGDRLTNLSDCDDTAVTIRALRDKPAVIDIMAAGTAMRFLTAYLAATPGEHVITGTERMKHRPIKILVDALRRLGADITYEGEEGFPPLRIRGRQLEGGRIDVPGNVSSQYISALLMIGPTLSKGLQLHLTGEIISRPYIDLTLWIMARFGAEAEWSDIDTVEVNATPYLPVPHTVESDWSAASYWYEMLAIGASTDSRVTLNGLRNNSRQGDSIARYIGSLLGVKTSFEVTAEGHHSKAMLKYRPKAMHQLEYDFVSSPDLAQTFVVACCATGTEFRFTGVQSLKIKETDRIEALKRELAKLGYVIKDINGEELVWNGERCEACAQPVIDTYQDHRMAMAFAPMALKLGEIRINNPEVVSKSYPHFWSDLRKAGFTITEEEVAE